MKFIWMKDGKELAETKNVRFKHESGYSMLFFEPVEVNSGGNYTCVVKNRAGLDSYTTFLDVEAPPRWVETAGDQKMAFGSEVKLHCQATGSPPPKVTWERYVEAIQAWTKLGPEGESLEIPRVTINETGRYRCKAANGVKPETSHDFLVSIYGAPKIQPFSFPNRLKVFGRASVMCTAADGTQPFTFSWLKDGVSMADVKNVREKKESDFSALIIEPVEASHAGNYTCIVKNKAGFDSHSAYLEVEEKSKEWTAVRNETRAVVGEDGTITLESATESHSGEFKCSADNGIGRHIFHTFAVKVRVIEEMNNTVVAIAYIVAVLFVGVFPSLGTSASTQKVPPKILAFQFRKTIKPGENARTTCLVEAGDTPMTFSWLRNGVDASATKNVHVDTHSDYSVLNVSPVDATSAGNFTCIVKNKAGFDSFTAYLDVEAPPEWKREPMDKSGVVGSTVRIDCLGSGSPAPKMSWHIARGDGFQQSVSDAIASRTTVHENGTLVLHELDKADSGQYTCTADNGVAPVLRKTITLKINVTPKIIAFSFAGTAKPGNNVRTTCFLAEGDMPVTFTWLRNGVDASQSKNVHIVSHSDFSVLSINPVDGQSAGNYTCIAKNRAGFDSFMAFLDVEDVSPSNTKAPQPRETDKNGTLVISNLETHDAGQYVCEADNGIAPTLRKTVVIKVTEVPEIRPFGYSKNIPVGGKALVTCLITSGVQPVTFSWLKDGQSLHRVQGTRLKADPDYSVLLLEPVLPSHVGNYTCIAKNKFGFDSYTTILEVESSPAWKKVSGDMSVVLGGTLVIECLASGFPRPTITFRKTSHKHDKPPITQVERDRTAIHRNGTVIITRVSLGDTGEYSCEAENGVPPSIRHTVKVSVNATTEAPKLQAFTFPGSVKPGSRISAICMTTSGRDQVTITWLKNGNDVSAEKNIFVETKRGVSVILIEPVEVSNAGNYTCIAKNRAGFDSYTAALDVQAPPSWKKTPADVRVNIGERAIFECLAYGSPVPRISWRKQGSK
ncbi:hemicentin-1-like [Rhipicephalus microplus]|uniref:hemicentin-1-like n=1 Tax=Rhipicephalus microplus TaxID=6941 RepID=UPI003F6D4BEB